MYHISKDKRSIESSKLLCKAFENLMSKNAFDQITISTLCSEAQIGRTTFYRHFDFIDDILRKKCDDAFFLLATYLKEYQNHKRSTDNFLTPFLRFWYINTTTLNLIFQAKKEYIISESVERILIPLEQQLTTQQPFMKTEYYIDIRSAVFIAVLKRWLRNNLTPSPDELSVLVVKQFQFLLNS